MAESAVKSKAYVSFIDQRDKALERLAMKSQLRITDELNKAFTRVLEIVSFAYPKIPGGSLAGPQAKYVMHSIQSAIDHHFLQSANVIVNEIESLKRKSYLLAATGEAEAILRATGKQTKIDLKDYQLNVHGKDSKDGRILKDSVVVAFNRISRGIIHNIELALIQHSTIDECLKKVVRAFPKRVPVTRPRKLLKKVREAKQQRPDIEVDATVPDAEWDAMVSDYLDEYVPEGRAPDDVYDVQMPGDTEENVSEIYGWEVQRDLNHEFVSSVRDGQNEAANQNGIVDFQNIAIIDDRTCESCCGDFGCVDFDGKTVSEIEEMTDGDQSSPPHHIKCRCLMAPMLDNMPDLPQSNEEEFNTWLTS